MAAETTSTVELSERLQARSKKAGDNPKYNMGKADWKAWPTYDGGDNGWRNYWYPVQWSSQVKNEPQQIEVCGEKVMIMRDADGAVRGLHDRCPHRGVCAVGGHRGVSRHGELPVPRLDVRPQRRRARRGDHRRSRLADVWQGRGQDLPGRGAHRAACGSSSATASRTRSTNSSPRNSSTHHPWRSADASRTATATSGSTPRTASTRVTPSTCTALRCGGRSR